MSVNVTTSQGNTVDVSVSGGNTVSFTQTSTSISVSSPSLSTIIVTEKGPKGDTGATGATGATGSTGERGLDATTYSISCVDGDNSDEEKIRLTGTDSSTDDVVLEAGTGLSIARSSDKITFTNTVSDTNTQLSDEQVQDIVGAMFTGNTETRISATYQDADGTIDLAVDDMNSTDVTLAGTPDYITISGQEITRNQIDLAADVTGVLPHANIGGDAIDGDNIADDSINSEHYVDQSIDTAHIKNQQVTYAKIQDVTNARMLGNNAGSDGVVTEMTAANVRTFINVENGATADQTQGDINGLAITTVGALGSGSISSGFGNIDIGSSTFDTTGAVSTGIITPTAIKHAISGNNAGDYGTGAEILFGISNDTTTVGEIYVLRAGTWTLIDADIETTSTLLAAVAVGTNSSTDGMLIRGCVTLNSTYTAGTDSEGAIVYASATAGEATLTAPSSSGQFVRILGYSLNVSDKKMFFNPDNTFVEIA